MYFYTNAHQRSNDILLRGYRDGKRVHKKVAYKPYLFVPSRAAIQSEYRSLDGDFVKRMDFADIRDAREFCKTHGEIGNFKIHGMTQYVYPFLNDEFPGELDYDQTMVKKAFLDIEVDSKGSFPDVEQADKAITAITVSDGKTFWAFGLREFAPTDDDVVYIQCSSETDLLLKFLNRWVDIDADIVTGWNIETFDMPYLVNRITRVLGEVSAKRLSPWNLLREDSIVVFSKKVATLVPVGITVLDYLPLYRKFTYSQQESYTLSHIAMVELGEDKIDYEAEGYDSLADLYERNHDLYMSYNVKDVRLVVRFEEKLGFIAMAIATAYDAKVNFIDALTSVRLWDVIIHNYLMDRKIAVPPNKHTSKADQIEGAYVKSVTPGVFDWVVSFDLTSLYPHLIMQYNISPETLMGKLPGMRADEVLNSTAVYKQAIAYARENDYALAANGTVYRRDRIGFLPALMQKVFDDRKRAKKQMLAIQSQLQKTKDPALQVQADRLNSIQMAKKIQLNSAYGATSNEYFRYYNDDLAEAITVSGQVAIRWAEAAMNKYINDVLGNDKEKDYIIASDTDSLYIHLEDMVNRFFAGKSKEETVALIDKVCEQRFQHVIDDAYDGLEEHTNAYAQKMFMKREAIADRGIWVAKKRYILNIYNNEGVAYKEPKLKVLGLEFVRSTTPAACKKALYDCYKIAVSGTQQDLHKYVAQFREHFCSLPFREVATPTGCNNVEKYSLQDENLPPIHVRAALVHNDLIKRMGLKDKYQMISSEKIKFSYLKVPNPARQNVVACKGSGDLPPEFGLDKYIDHETQLRNNFLNPIESITSVMGWTSEPVSSLTEFFV